MMTYYFKKKILLSLTLLLSLFLVGSCNERSTFFDFAKTKPDLSAMNKGDLMRYAYALQAGLMNKPEQIGQLRPQDIKLALAEPDLNRAEGKARVWHYQSNACALDVYWREGMDSVGHHEFRARQTVSQKGVSNNTLPSSWACIQNIIETRRAAIDENLSYQYANLK